MNLEPKSLGSEDFKVILKDSSIFYLKNLHLLLPMFSPLALVIFMGSQFSIFFAIIPPVVTLCIFSIFEMVCTIYVGYKGSYINKMMISYKAALRNMKMLLKVHFLWISIFVVMIYIAHMRSILLSEDGQNYNAVLSLIYFSIAWSTFGYQIFSLSKLGCYSMFIKDSSECKVVEKIHISAFAKNIGFILKLFIVSLGAIILMAFSSIFLVFSITFIVTVAFFVFCSLYEPPYLNQKQEQKEISIEAVPDAT